MDLHQGKDGTKSIGNIEQPNPSDTGRSAPVDVVGPTIQTPRESPLGTRSGVDVESDTTRWSGSGQASPKPNVRSDAGRR